MKKLKTQGKNSKTQGINSRFRQIYLVELPKTGPISKPDIKGGTYEERMSVAIITHHSFRDS